MSPLRSFRFFAIVILLTSIVLVHSCKKDNSQPKNNTQNNLPYYIDSIIGLKNWHGYLHDWELPTYGHPFGIDTSYPIADTITISSVNDSAISIWGDTLKLYYIDSSRIEFSYAYGHEISTVNYYPIGDSTIFEYTPASNGNGAGIGYHFVTP